MHVGFDRQAFTIQKYGGISRYFTDLYLGLREKPGYKAELLFSRHQNAYLRDHGIGRELNPWAAKAYTKFMTTRHWSVPTSWVTDIHHSTYYLGTPKKRGREKKLVTTLYDMIPELLPQYFKQNPHANKLGWLKASDLIVRISDSAAADLAYFQPTLANRIRRIHLYSSFSAESPQTKPKLFAIEQGPYMLYVGQRGGYKNSSLLLRAFAASEPSRHGRRLIFAGGGEFSQKEQAEISKLCLFCCVQQIDVTDDKLWYLYRHAAAVLVPSIAEGFSLPLVEGLAADVPIICSDINVHREVAGDFAQLVHPLKHQDWADIFSSIQSLKRPSKQLGSDRYDQRCKYYSKERMVMEHIRAYQAANA